MVQEVLPIRGHFYILSTSDRIDDRRHALKGGDTFAVFDRCGDIENYGSGELGLYHRDTRYLSRLVLKLEGVRPLLLSSSVKDDNALLAVDATNPDIERNGSLQIPHGTLHLFRSKVLWDHTCYGRVRLRNHGLQAVRLNLLLEVGADFADIFEVRGFSRKEHGRSLPVQVEEGMLVFGWDGRDGRRRRTRVAFDPAPDALSEGEARYEIHLEAGGQGEFRYAVSCEEAEPARGDSPPPRPILVPYEEAVRQASAALRRARAETADIHTSNEQFNDWLNRSLADLNMLRTDSPHGAYPYAGIPWFCTPFGRDGIFAALACLSFNTSLARGVLAYLAANQAEAEDPARDAEPGKILHEAREGEMALAEEVPFHRYYGSVDATPLFVMLAGAYYERTADLEFLRSLWPHVVRALQWVDRYGDHDGDGFVEYRRRTPRGLVNQGWKDSEDSVFHADGSLAEGPIALCEVQGYVYAARCAAARLAAALGERDRARPWMQAAKALRDRFETAFWCEDLSTYALALDGDKRPCRVRTSNPGHCLFTGIAKPPRARRVAQSLLGEASYSGWGVRTTAAGEARYNPLSYHNGSVWPHDNALIAAGFARYGLKKEAAKILAGLFDATLFFDHHRLPELFCGLPRRPGEGPTLYPGACSPQAWAAAAVFLLLESCLGLKVQATGPRLVLANPHLPGFLERVEIRNLQIGDACVDLIATRHEEGDVSVNVTRRCGKVRVIVSK